MIEHFFSNWHLKSPSSIREALIYFQLPLETYLTISTSSKVESLKVEFSIQIDILIFYLNLAPDDLIEGCFWHRNLSIFLALLSGNVDRSWVHMRGNLKQ